MFRNYLTVALRNFARHKIYSIINLGGLTIAVACCLLLGLFVRHELSFDRFNTKADRLYRAWTEEEYKGDRFRNVTTPFVLGPTLKETFPEVEAMARVRVSELKVRKGAEVFNENVHMVEPDLFRMFDFPLLNSVADNPLRELYSVVLTEEVARKYFGAQNPVGKTLTMQLDSVMQDFTVTAVARNLPTASSVRFGMAVSMEHIKDLRSDRTLKSWFMVEPETYVLLREGSAPDPLAAKFPAMLKTALGDKYKGDNYAVHLQPLTDIHLNPELAGGFEPVSNPMYVYILSALSVFLLLIACINFMTLSLGRSVSRAQEVGVRKAMGALRSQLMNQFWSEALLMTAAAVLLGLGLAVVLLPWFGTLANQQLTFQLDGTTIGLLAGLVLVIGLVAGSYPALVLSGFRPVEVLKGRISVKGDGSLFRRGLVVVQFCLSVMLIGSTIVLNQQLNYLQSKSLGYQKEQTIVVPVGQSGEEGRQLVERFRNEAAGHKEILSVAASAFPFASGEWGEVGFTDDNKVYRNARFNIVDPYFLPAYGIKLKAGRNFDPKNTADHFGGIIVNEAFLKTFGLKDPLNQRVSQRWHNHRIIGVTEDFHYASLHSKVEPLLLMVRPDSVYEHIENLMFMSSPSPDLSIRVAAGSLADRTALLGRLWKRVAPNEPFSYTFLDEDLQRQYRAEQRLGRIVTIASGLSILIACLGLFGLATLAVARRTKEIGVRKVLGASVPSLVLLLAKDFLKLVGVAIVIASPLAWYAMNRWLQDFEYRVAIQWWVFALAGVVAVLVAFLTVSFQSVKAAFMNPVTSLRAE
ncbi:ABC transporter permease [Tellurirhabdus rosea]|uniref:ABC transporter permease n=1 Tax=Tellurirhabdus rosea TaxID=2674997 RepID=UPI002253411B|nr:ABC transporter permease [Tellurirhabdus rosea]